MERSAEQEPEGKLFRIYYMQHNLCFIHNVTCESRGEFKKFKVICDEA